jgi:hypothetical protein
MTEEELQWIEDEIGDCTGYTGENLELKYEHVRALIAEVRRLKGRRLYNKRKLRPRLVALCQAMHGMYPPKNAKVSVNKNGRPEIRWPGKEEDDPMDWAEFAPWHFEMSDEAFDSYVKLMRKAYGKKTLQSYFRDIIATAKR